MSRSRFWVRTLAYGPTTDRSIRNFKQIKIEDICPLLWAAVHKTVTLVETELFLKGKVRLIIYLLCEVGKAAKLRNQRAFTEQIHSIDFKILEIVRLFGVTSCKCGVR